MGKGRVQGLPRTPQDVVAEVILSKAVFKGIYLLVEGDADSRFWRAHTKLQVTQIVICRGKKTAIRSIEILNGSDGAHHLAVLDDDLDSIFGNASVSNVFVTDDHDLESMLLASPALERAVDELADAAKLAAFIDEEHRSVRDALIYRSLPFAQLRYLALANRLGVDFSELPTYKYIDQYTWGFNRAQLIADFALKATWPTEYVEQQMTEVPMVAAWTLIHGHDAERILRRGFERRLSRQPVSVDQISAYLRLAFTTTMLSHTRLWKALQQWESINNLQMLQPL